MAEHGRHLTKEERAAFIRDLAAGKATMTKLAGLHGINETTASRIRREVLAAGAESLLRDGEQDEAEAAAERHDARFWRERAGRLQKDLDGAHNIIRKIGVLDGLRVGRPDFAAESHAVTGSRATLICHTSDWHIGEKVEPSEINGWNSYDLETAERRVRRLAGAAIELGRRWAGPDTAIDGVLLTMGGDAISGDIHEELSRTNEIESLPAVRAAARLYIGLIEQLATEYGRVHGVAVPGNHGRTTKKPTAKKYGALSYDIFIARLVADAFANDERVTFAIADGPDVMTLLYRYPVLCTHGDKIGTGGGQGFAGPVLPIIRGGHKVRAQYAQAGPPPHLILCGHYHTSANPPGILANGSLVGLSEFGFGIRGAWEPPKQWLAMVRERWGLSERLDVQLEQPAQPEKPRVRPVSEPAA